LKGDAKINVELLSKIYNTKENISWLK